MIAGDDDHKLENNPGRVKAIEAASAVNGVAIFSTVERETAGAGMTDFNDLALENARPAKNQLEEAVWHARRQGQEQTGEPILRMAGQ